MTIKITEQDEKNYLNRTHDFWETGYDEEMEDYDCHCVHCVDDLLNNQQQLSANYLSEIENAYNQERKFK